MKFIYYTALFYPEMGLTRAGRKANNEVLKRLHTIQEMAISRQGNYYAIEDADLSTAIALGARETNVVIQKIPPCGGCKYLWMPKIGDVYVLPFDELRYTKNGNLLVCVLQDNHIYSGVAHPLHYYVNPDGKYLGYCSPAEGEHLRTVCPLTTLTPLPSIELAVEWNKIEILTSIPEGATEPIEDCRVYKAETKDCRTLVLMLHPGDQHHELSLPEYWRLRQSDYYCEYTQQWVEVRPNLATLRMRYKTLGELGIKQLKRELRKKPNFTRRGRRQPGKR